MIYWIKWQTRVPTSLLLDYIKILRRHQAAAVLHGIAILFCQFFTKTLHNFNHFLHPYPLDINCVSKKVML